MSWFTSLAPNVIGAMIREAKERVAYSAPSLDHGIASALVSAHNSLGGKCVVIVDYSESLFRLGYGHNDSVDMLIENNVPIRKQSNLRLGTIIVDNQGWVFSSLPMAVESQYEMPSINALEMSPEQVAATWEALNPSSQKQDGVPAAEIGKEALHLDEVKRVSQAIKQNPPQAFDLQRQVRVYQAHLQFVEIELEGGRIEQRTVRLPTEFKEALFAKDKDIEKRLNANYKLLDARTSQEFDELREQVKKLRETYAPSLGARLGRVLLLARKKEFSEKIKELQEQLEAYTKQSLLSIQDTIEASLESLALNLAPVVAESPPEVLKARCTKVTPEIAKEYLLDALYKAAPSAKTLLANTKLNVTYKDVTIEMLEDKEFQRKVTAEFRYEDWAKPFVDYAAAKSGK